MTSQTSNSVTVLSIACEQRVYPPYDAFHSTPSAMLWRRVTFETPHGQAVFEQTDYGHAGRLNDWEPRGIASAMVPRLAQLRAALEALAPLIA